MKRECPNTCIAEVSTSTRHKYQVETSRRSVRQIPRSGWRRPTATGTSLTDTYRVSGESGDRPDTQVRPVVRVTSETGTAAESRHTNGRKRGHRVTTPQQTGPPTRFPPGHGHFDTVRAKQQRINSELNPNNGCSGTELGADSSPRPYRSWAHDNTHGSRSD